MPLRDILRKKEEEEENFVKAPSSSTSPLRSPAPSRPVGLASSTHSPPSPPPPPVPPKDSSKPYSDASRPDRNKAAAAAAAAEPPPPPQFTIVRTTTTTEEVIQPPSFYSEDGNYHHDDDEDDENGGNKKKDSDDRPASQRNSRFRWSSYSSSRRRRRRSSKQSIPSDDDDGKMKEKEKYDVGEDGGGGAGKELLDGGRVHGKDERRLSDRLHLRSPRLRSGSRSRSSSTASSANLPAELTELELGDKLKGREDDDKEAEWEKRATALGMARADAVSREGSREGSVASLTESVGDGSAREANGPRMRRGSNVGDEKKDSEIQEAIQLHEEGCLEQSTALFGKLADPNGANNPLSQVLYGLALRHGWGCRSDAERALTYLSHAASNSADIESIALRAGMKKGGAAKGELVLAIFELGNCYRHAWGVPKKDPVAARHYYETAANLGDLDAMNEIAWCYLEGFGCKKDKHKAAQYLRRAEEKGGKTVGNSWIWKEKYNPILDT